jgi:hypothetical protein
MVFLVGEANAKASGSNPTFGFVFVIPPVWHILHEFKKSLLPLFTCSAVNVTVFDEFKGTVRVASSSVIAQDAGLKANNTKREIMLRFKILVNFS